MNQRPGFSLLEVLVSLTLMVSIFLIVVSSIVSALRDNRSQQERIAAIDHANAIVRSTVSLIRQAEPSATGAYPIAAATANSLTWFTATKGSLAIQQARLFLNGSTLQLGLTPPVGSPATYPSNQEVLTTLLTGIGNGGTPLLQYYDKNYTGSQSAMNPIVLTDIRLVKLTLIYDDNPNAPPSAATIELQAALRNLKDNY